MLRNALKRLAPAPLLHAVRLFRQVEPGARATLLRLATRRALGRDGAGLPRSLRPAPNVLFICHGNILRSPLAEALYRERVAGTPLASGLIASAGLHASEGRGADRRGIALAPEFGVSMESHRARALTSDMICAADLVLVMDRSNEAETVSRYPESADKVFLLAAVAGSGGPPVIPDPYSGGVVEVRVAYQAVEAAVGALVDRFRSRENIPS